MRVLVDINIFEDIIRKRDNWEGSLEILEMAKNKKFQGFISALTIPIIYFLRKIPDIEAREKVKEVTKDFEIVDLTARVINKALNDNDFNDFEDFNIIQQLK